MADNKFGASLLFPLEGAGGGEDECCNEIARNNMNIWGDPPTTPIANIPHSFNNIWGKQSCPAGSGWRETDIADIHDKLDLELQLSKKTKYYVEWVQALIALRGSSLSEDEIFEEMRGANKSLTSTIIEEFGGISNFLKKASLSTNEYSPLNQVEETSKPYELQVEPASSDPDDQLFDQLFKETVAEVLNEKAPPSAPGKADGPPLPPQRGGQPLRGALGVPAGGHFPFAREAAGSDRPRRRSFGDWHGSRRHFGNHKG